MHTWWISLENIERISGLEEKFGFEHVVRGMLTRICFSDKWLEKQRDKREWSELEIQICESFGIISECYL